MTLLSEDNRIKHEIECLNELKKISETAKEWGIQLVLIGGYAVRAYAPSYRFTKDIDLAIPREAIGGLKALLKDLSYIVNDTQYGFMGQKKYNDNVISLHISAGKILDISTDFSLKLDTEFFERATEIKITAYYNPSHEFLAPVIDLETLLILKFLPIGRTNDIIDIISLITDKRKEIDGDMLVHLIKMDNGLKSRLRAQLQSYYKSIEKGQIKNIWFDRIGSRLSDKNRKEILTFIKKLLDEL